MRDAMTAQSLKFTDQARGILNRANAVAKHMGFQAPYPCHIVLALRGAPPTFATYILNEHGVDIEALCGVIERSALDGLQSIRPGGSSTSAIADAAAEAAKRLGGGFIGTEHVLIGALETADPALSAALDRIGLKSSELASKAQTFVVEQIEKGQQALLRAKKS